MGDPRRTGTIIKNDKQVKTITYSYAASGGEALEAEVIPARSQAYSFFEDKLVSEQFLSSFKSDNTNFDDTKISEIIKNKTTKAEVVTLLGKPTGQYIFPATSPNQTLQFGYIYQTVRGGVYTGFKIMIKSLLVGFNSNDVVSDIQYSISDSSK
jgi:hypothetical protein